MTKCKLHCNENDKFDVSVKVREDWLDTSNSMLTKN